MPFSFSDLLDQNPWWRGKHSIQDDPKIREFDRSQLKWDPRIGYKFNWDVDVVYTLRGPRQVGKTTLLKLWTRKLLIEKQIEPQRIVYYNCEIVDDYQQLSDLLAIYIDWVRARSNDRLYILLDEISSVKNWQKAIKYMADVGRLTRVTVILTGSHALDIKDSVEKLPGRRGKVDDVLDKVLVPMKFSEYVEATAPYAEEIFRSIPRSWEHRRELIDSLFHEEGLFQKVGDLLPYVQQLNQTLDKYLLTGGMPSSVDAYITTGEIPEYVYRTYIDSVLGDMHHYGKRDRELRQVIRAIMETSTTPVSWAGLSKRTDVSFPIVEKYIDALDRCFITHYLYNLDMKRMRPDYRGNKKIYFSDPLMLHAMSAWSRGSSDFFRLASERLLDNQMKSKIVEGVLANHLVRLAFNLNPTSAFDYKESLLYWKSKKAEVDFNLMRNGKVLSIELKYQHRIGSDNARCFWGLQGKKSGKGLLLSIDQGSDFNGYRIVPLSLFLFLV